jgi:beta-1,4-mannosyl-glycoprotein beta-1,4-N-acetylglucosaminyltransferase
LKQVTGYRDDDIFLLNDADELPRRELLLFLKLHDGYPLPVGFHMHWTLYGFFWGVPLDYSHVCAVTIAFLRDLLHWGGISIRNAENYVTSKPELQKALAKFVMDSGSPFGLWKAGRFGGEMAGWHCSWCCSTECVLVKLVSAQNGDFPRWGDFPEKRNITYIRSLIKRGLWFDDKSFHKLRTIDDPMFAPVGVLQRKNDFAHILTNPYS